MLSQPSRPCPSLLASVRVVRYGRALRAIKELVAKSGRNPDEFALHSLRIGGATTLGAGETYRNE